MGPDEVMRAYGKLLVFGGYAFAAVVVVMACVGLVEYIASARRLNKANKDYEKAWADLNRAQALEEAKKKKAASKQDRPN